MTSTKLCGHNPSKADLKTYLQTMTGDLEATDAGKRMEDDTLVGLELYSHN